MALLRKRIEGTEACTMRSTVCMPEPVFLGTSHPKCQPCVVVAGHVEWVQAPVQNPSSKSFLKSLAILQYLYWVCLFVSLGCMGVQVLQMSLTPRILLWAGSGPEIPEIEILCCSYPPPPKIKCFGSTLCMYTYIYVLPL